MNSFNHLLDKSILFLGDSITADKNHNYISMMLNMLSHDIGIDRISIINAGEDNNNVFDLIDKIPDIFFEHSKIDICVIFCGINDSKIFYGTNQPLVPVDLFYKKYLELIELIKSKNHVIKFLLIQLPSILINEIKNSDFLDGFWYWENEIFDEYTAAICTIAAENNIGLVELSPTENSTCSQNPRLFEHDGVHPNALGHKIIAINLLEALKKIHTYE